MTIADHFPADLWQTMGEIYPLKRYFVGPDYDRAIALLGRHLDLRVHSFPPDDVVNQWMIPPSWECRRATISRGGRCLYDAAEHGLRIIALSAPFAGSVSRDELRRHLHWHHRHDQWIPWHFRQLYRPWDRTWGFCVPKTFYDALEPGDYEVVIETEEHPAPLEVPDCTLPGRRAETIVLVAHLDHPQMANDDLAGVMVGVRVMQLLAERPRRFTYRLVFTQEIIGSEYYLARMEANGEKQNFLLALFLEMLGTDTPLALQLSYRGASPMDHALRTALEASGQEYRVAAFRKSAGNDEINWEAHGIPMPSLSRFPYPEYHSDRDDMSIVSPQRLEQSAQLVVEALDRLEEDRWVRKKFCGSLCLSHPSYDLYVDAGQPAFGQHPSEQIAKLRTLMDALPMELVSPRTLRELADQVGLSRDVAEAYLRRWEEKGLIEIL